MKGVRCSWVDMLAIRQALAAAGNGRGSQKHIERTRCVKQSTVCEWKIACDVIDATAGKVRISELSHVQPSHAVVIGRAYRRLYKSNEFTDDVSEEIADVVTVSNFRPRRQPLKRLATP